MTEPAMPPRLGVPEALKPERLQAVFRQSDTWVTSEWTDGDLVLSSAALKHMLRLVEREMGKRKMISPTRGQQ